MQNTELHGRAWLNLTHNGRSGKTAMRKVKPSVKSTIRNVFSKHSTWAFDTSDCTQDLEH